MDGDGVADVAARLARADAARTQAKRRLLAAAILALRWEASLGLST
jgi:hypothetical protein